MDLLSSNSSSTAIRDELELIPLNLQSPVPLDRSFDQSQALLSLSLGNQGLYSSPYFIREDGSTSHISFDSHGRNCSGQYMFESSDIANVGLNCRYLKPAQELLDEMVSVWKTLKPTKLPLNSEISGDLHLPPEIPTNQDLNEKMSKLLNVLDELDGRYRQYRNQMEMLVTSFETLAGYSSSKLYTTLALQTISRQFRCIRDAINSQIRVIQRSLGEELEATTPSSSQGRLTRLRNLDLQFRQQHKSLQQFGIMQQQQQQQSWRPQRGLPENSVSILRAWLFEHFLNPYPKDSEKIMLARQAGLTRGQVANWFINARVRLWKPMVEEIYKEEFGENAKASIPEDEWKQQNHHNQKTTETNGQNLVEEGNPLIANESGDTLYDEIGELGDLMVENQVSLALGLPYSERITSLPATDRMPFDPNYIWEMNGR